MGAETRTRRSEDPCTRQHPEPSDYAPPRSPIPAAPSTSALSALTCAQSSMTARRADDVILCASELAANAAQHSRSRLPGGTFTVRAIISPDHYARIEVQDNGGPWNQGMIDPTRHHGLDIVRAVADEWGIDGDNTTRTIWARFDCPE